MTETFEKTAIDKIIDCKAQKIKEHAIEAINRIARSATSDFQTAIDTLKEQAKIILPVNVLELLVNGGLVKAGEVNLLYDDARVNLIIGDRHVFHDCHSDEPRIPSAKYRYYVILEKLGPAEKKDC